MGTPERNCQGERVFDRSEVKNTFEILFSPEFREELLRKVDALIDRVRAEGVTTMVFLDKSARPISWLVKERLHVRFPKEAVPDIKFLNFGSSYPGLAEAKASASRQSENGRIAKERPSGLWIGEDDVRSPIREHFKVNDRDRERLRDAFGKSFDKKRVLVIDEVVYSWLSTEGAMVLLKECFPDIQEIHATCLFSQHELGGVFDVEKHIPWFRKPERIGVTDNTLADSAVETNDGIATHVVQPQRIGNTYEDLFAAPINKDFLAREQARIEKGWDDPEREIRHLLELHGDNIVGLLDQLEARDYTCLDSSVMNRMGILIRSNIPFVTESSVSGMLAAVRYMMQTMRETGDPEKWREVASAFSFKLENICDLMIQVGKIFPDPSLNILFNSEANALRVFDGSAMRVRDVAKIALSTKRLQAAVEQDEEKAQKRSQGLYRNSAQQLRAEMRRLAQTNG